MGGAGAGAGAGGEAGDGLERRAAGAVRKKAELRRRGVRGQTRARGWVVLDLGVLPDPSYDPWGAPDKFSLKFIHTSSGTERCLGLAELRALGEENYMEDWHCVTGWTAPGVGFRGVPLRRVLEHLGEPFVKGHWKCLHQTGADTYTVNVAREDALDPRAFLCTGDADGKLLPREHGGVRLVFPHLFGWKSCKWLTEVCFLPEDRMGFWEKLGCHPRGRVDRDERWASEARGLWVSLVGDGQRPGIMMGFYMAYMPQWVWEGAMQLGGWLLGAFTLRVSRWLGRAPAGSRTEDYRRRD